MKKVIQKTGVICLIALAHLSIIAQVKQVGPIGITVNNMQQSVKFYSDVLGFKKVSDTELYGENYEQLQGIFGLRMRIVRMHLGEEEIELTDYLTIGGRSIPEDAKSNDLIFQHIAIVVSDMDKAYEHLRKYMVMHVSTAPQTIPASNITAAGIRAFYFHDPDMHNLELIYFPKGKGQPKWQQHTKEKLFLGIDHTAIAVSNTDSSLHFYENILGILRKGDSWNMGMEQARLNFVEGASLHITGLSAAQGPGIEFLQYLQPGTGKPYPANTRPDDIWYWQTTLFTDDINNLYEQLKASSYKLLSKQLVTLRSKEGKSYKAFIVQDGDGHALLIREM